jgi:hypothetical protein
MLHSNRYAMGDTDDAEHALGASAKFRGGLKRWRLRLQRDLQEDDSMHQRRF